MNEESNEESIIEVITNTTTDLLTDVALPAPIKKSLFKALGQLCTAAVDVPVSILEGKSAEKRAETTARLKIIETSANQIAKKMDVNPEYAKVAVEKFSERILKEQINLDEIAQIATNEVEKSLGQQQNSLKDEKVKDQVISDDWLNAFGREASQKSSEEMKLLFGKILAGEIKKPSTFSIRTLKLLSQLDNEAAELFQRLCSLCVSLQFKNEVIDARVICISGTADQNSLNEYGLPFKSLNILEDYGLISSNYNTTTNYGGIIAQSSNIVPLPMTFQGSLYGLISDIKVVPNQELKVSGVMLSSSGKELLSIVDVTPDSAYFNALKAYFKNQKLNLVQVKT